jgi:peroxiredoxin
MFNFLESDYLSSKRILIFGINRIQSDPTIKHIKNINDMRNQFLDAGIDEIYLVSICDFLLFDQIMDKLAPNSKSVQLSNSADIKNLLNKKEEHSFLKENWQFAAVVNKKKIEYYIEQPFLGKLGPDTLVNIYNEVNPKKILEWLKSKTY